MKHRPGWISCAALAALLASAAALPTKAAAPEGGVDADEWVNLVGEAPTLEALEGQAVLLHFFGPQRNGGRGRGRDDGGGLPQSYFMLIRKFHHEYSDKGLVILGICDQNRSTVGGYLDSYDIPYPIAIGGSTRSAFKVEGPNHLILLDRKGEVYWRGPCNGLWNGKLLKGIKGAKRLGERGLLALHLDLPVGKRLKKAAEQCAAGELAKALQTTEGLLEKERTEPADRAEAEAVHEAIESHVARTLEQVETCNAAREVLLAKEGLEVLSKELKKHELGAAPAARLEEMLADEELAEEIEAAELYQDLLADTFRRGLSKNLARLEKLIEQYPATRAAVKARNLSAGR